MRNIILGTAGHIDHGKSSLVKAMTGVDPDRLKEEKERGITIDIGFADLAYPDTDMSVGIIDVPGHERLIRNMLAGAGGIDMLLFVIAADEGIMPQSREHLSICNLLKIKKGLIAVTKADLVEPEWLALVQDEVRDFIKGTFLEGAQIIAVSSKTGLNIEKLKEEIKQLAMQVEPKTTGGIFRLPIDRVFTLKGFGTVITGTALSGSISVDDPVEILPAGIKTKVRGLHSHGRAIQKAYAGQRVAINLQGVEKEQLKRGDVAVPPSIFSVTRTLNVHLTLLPDSPDLKTKSLVHFYCGTAEVIARIILLDRDTVKAKESCYCQLRLKEPVVVMSGDRYIIRRFSPLETLGGGPVLDPFPVKRRKKDGITDLVKLYRGSLEEKIEVHIQQSGMIGIGSDQLPGWIDLDRGVIEKVIEKIISSGKIIRSGERLIHKTAYESIHERITAFLSDYHKKNPLKPGLQKEELRTLFAVEPGLFNFIVSSSGRITVDKNLIRLKDFKVALTGGEEEYSSKIIMLLDKNPFQPPLKDELMNELKVNVKKMNDMLSYLLREGRVIKINNDIYVSSKTFSEIIMQLKRFFSAKNEITVSEFRDLLGTSRKYALPFLEYCDTQKITLRVGDARRFMLKEK